MAVRKGPGGSPGGNDDPAGRDPVESGQQDDRARVDDAEGTPGEVSELTENRDGAPPENTGTGAAESEDRESQGTPENQAGDEVSGESAENSGDEEPAEVLVFRPRAEDSQRDEITSEADLPEDEDSADFDDLGDEPVDLSALQDDDALLDALGGADPDIKQASGEDEPDLEALLVAWRRDVDSTPIGDLVDVDAAVAAIEEGRRPRLRKRRHLVPVATAAAVLMIAFTGVGLAARDAMPGDALWGVAQVFYADHARSAQAATVAQTELANAGTALDQGRRSAAESALKRAREQIQTVDPDHGLHDLQVSYASLTKKYQRGQQPQGTSSSTHSTSDQPSTSQPPPPPPPSELPPPPPSSTSGVPSTSTSAPSETSPPPSSSGSSQPSSGTGGWSSSAPGGGLWPQSSTPPR